MYAELKKSINGCPCYFVFMSVHNYYLPTVLRIFVERLRIHVINRSSNGHIQGNNELPNFFSELFMIENYNACL